MTEIRFTVPGQPVAKGRPKAARQCQKSFHKNLMWKVSEIRDYLKQLGAMQ